MPATSPDAKPTSWRCGTARDNARPTTGSRSELAEPAHGVPVGRRPRRSRLRSRDRAYSGVLGFFVEVYEPLSWAEELVEPGQGRRTTPPGIPLPDGVAVLYHRPHRGAVRYTDAPSGCSPAARRRAVRQGRLPLQCVHYSAQPERWVRVVSRPADRGSDTPAFTTACLVWSGVAGRSDEAMAAADGLIHAPKPPAIPCVFHTRSGCGWPSRRRPGAPRALRAAWPIAQTPGTGQRVAHGGKSALLEADHGDPQPPRLFALAIRGSMTR